MGHLSCTQNHKTRLGGATWFRCTFGGLLLDEAPCQSSVMEPPPKANVEMPPSSASTTQSMTRDIDSNDASGHLGEESGPTKGNTSAQGSSLGKASAGGIMATISTDRLPEGLVIESVKEAPQLVAHSQEGTPFLPRGLRRLARMPLAGRRITHFPGVTRYPVSGSIPTVQLVGWRTRLWMILGVQGWTSDQLLQVIR